MNNKFQNLTVDFSQLRSIPIQERVTLAGSPLGNSIFGNMSPTEIARLFPKYYQETVPTIAGMSSAVSGGTNMGGGSGGSGKRNNVAPAEPVPLTLAQRIAQAANVKRNPMVPGSFSTQAPGIMRRLMSDFGVTREQAAGIVGNLGHESAGLQAGIQELKPRAGRGGLGWAQWTGVRRVAFEKYLVDNGLEATDPEANYGFLKQELLTTHKSALEAVRNTTDTEQATKVFEQTFEKAADDAKHYDARNRYAQQALEAYDTADPTENTHIQDGTDAAPTDLITDGTTTGPEPTARITPETIGSVEGLDPKVAEYAATLSGADATQFYENLNTVGNIDEINRMSKETPASVGETASQQPVSSTNIIPENSLTERYNNLRQNYSEDVGRDSPIWNEIDPVFGQNLDHDRNNRTMSTGILDWDTDKVSRETLIAADAAAKVLRKYGYAPRIANGGGGNDHSANHGSGRDKNYAIDMAAFDQEGRAITLAQLPKDIKQEMYQAARLTAANDTGMALGYTMNNTSAHLQAGDDTREMSFWGYSNGPGNSSSASLQNTQEGQEFLNQMQQISQMTPEQRADHLDKLTNTQRYDQVNPTPNEHIQTNDAGAVETDAAPVPLATDTETTTEPEQPTAVPEQAAEVPAQQMAQGGYIDQKDNLQVVDKNSGDVKAEINNGELQDGIDAKGGGLQVKSNVTRKADDLIQKYDEQTNIDLPTDPAAKKARPEERDPIQGGMSSPIQNSQAAGNIGNIPGTNAFNEIHASLHRAYGLSRDRMNYGNVS